MLISVNPTLEEELVSPSRSRFTLGPLEPGFGYTLGNSLRRTLLSSVPGAAVTSVKVEGALHEFTTIEGVKEDLTEIILNVKALVLSSESDEPVTMYLEKETPGVVTAADLRPPAGVEVHNPELHIATLNDQAKLRMELIVERGRGYVAAAISRPKDREIGHIPVDQIYSPVLKVSYKVDATRFGQRTDFDKLIVDVETKNSMSPRDAVASAGATLCELFGLARELNLNAEGIELKPGEEDPRTSTQYNTPLEDLNFTVRSLNCLRRQDIHTVGALAECNESDLMDIRNFGQKSINEVKVKLARLGLHLKDAPSDFDPSTIEGYNPDTGDFMDTDPE